MTSAGTFRLNGVHYRVGAQHGFERVLIITNGDTITVIDLIGEVLVEHTRPGPGVKYVVNGRPPGGPRLKP